MDSALKISCFSFRLSSELPEHGGDGVRQGSINPEHGLASVSNVHCGKNRVAHLGVGLQSPSLDWMVFFGSDVAAVAG